MSKPAAIENIYPLTPLQSGLLFHTLMEPNSGVYFEQLTCELHGTLDEAAFAQAWKTLVERHPILRTAFVWKGQREPVQVVHRALELPWRKEDWRGVEGEQQAEKLKAYLAADRRRGFELNRAPLMRLATIQLASNVWQLVCSHHHILLDGWSFPLLLREFGECYRAYCTGLVPQLPPARPFSSYIAWLKERDGAKAEAFWREQLRGFAAPTPLVIGHPVGAAKPGETAQYREFDTHLAPQDVQLFQATARELRITLNTLVQGAYSLVLSRYSGLDDVMFGVTVAGRPAELPGVEQIVGLFINTLPLRVQVRPDFEAAPWLVRLQDSQLAMQEFEYAGLSDMQRWSEVTPGQPLFESLLVFESYPIDSSLPSKLGGLEPRGVSFIERSNLPLTIIVLPGERMGIRVSYDASRMDGQAVERMVGHIIQVLRGLSRPGIRLGQIELLTPQERESMLALPAPVVALEEGPATIHEWFMAQSRITPKAIALTDSGVQISYQELDEQSTRLARHLMAEGVEPRDRVGLLVERNAALVTGILAILKAGAAYVPMDPIYPDDRLAWIASDSGVKAVVTQRSLAGRVSGAAHICIEDEGTHADANPLDGMVGADDGAYVIYTSGSTGRPKGCVITHRNVTRLFKQTEHWFGFSAADVWTLFHSAAFDFSVWELWGSLLYGGRLVIVPYYTSREPEAFLELVRRERVTVLNQTPSAFRQFMAVEERQTSRAGLALRWVIFGGEALDLATLRPWFARHGDARPQLVNMYGITETTVHVTYRSLTTLDAEQNRGSLIGEPIPDLRLVTLDSCGQLAAVGIPGELYVAGAGLSPGYLKRPALSAERFVADPFALAGTGGRLYRTGDLARRLAGGDFEYLGRADHQVKIRGFRIELGEIESELSALPGVRECLVMMRDERLVAYVAARSGAALQADGLRGGLLQRLPEYMVPAVFVWIDKMPLTPNGKVDRAALPSPISQLEDGAGEYLAPRNEREAMLAEIWREVLQVNRVGVRDSYFALGGDSIRSLAIRSKARDKGIEFSLQDLFEKQTIEALCGGEQVVVQTASEAAPSAAPFSQLGEYDRTLLPADVEDAYPLTSLQLGMLFHSHQHAGSSQYLDTFSFQLRGSFDHAVLQASLGGLVERHAVLRTSFDLAALPEPIQRVHRQIAVPIGHSDLLGLDETAQQAAIHAFVKREATLAFNWAQAPLFRVHVHERGTSFQFTLSAHHAILDGWSVASLLTELFRDYLIGLGAPGNSPAKLESPTFGHFVALERAAASNKGSREFWTSALESAPVLALPKPFANSSAIADAATSRGRCLTLPVEVGTDVSAGLVRLAESLGVPVKSVLLTAHVRVLSLLGGNEDVVTGLVSNGRPEEVGADRLAGLFLNLLPLRLQLPEGTWADAVTAVFAMEKAMMPHRRVPLADIQRWLGAGPLLDTDFNFVNFHVFDALRGMDSLQLVDSISSEETNLALAANFSMQGVNGSVHGSLTVNQELVDHAVAQALPGLYLDVLTALAKTPRSLWRATVIGTPPLSHDTAEPFPEELLLHDLVEAQADRTPDAAAMIDEQRTLTYAQLEREANQLAHWLIGKGIGAEHRVGIAVARSAELVIAMLAALKAGAAWVPLDPDYPAERLALLERESGATVIVTDALLAENRVAIAAEPVGRPAIEVWPESAAYVLFTSGSTGTPKGVVVPHSAIVNHMFWMQGVFPLGAHDVVLQKTPAGFDAAVWEFWAPLMAGAVLVMAKPGGHQDPEYLAQVVREHEVTTLQLVPSMLKFFIEAAERTGCPSLRRVFSGGEALREETRDRFFQTFEAELVNLYGPTEVTIDSVVQRCGADGEIPIGRPIANVQAWVLDANLSPVPLGVPGELYLGGAGVARGYLGRAGLTAERFVPDHLSPWAGMRLYRTGDWVRQSADGTLYFIGRADNQVKIRGQRIELGEIEAALETIAAVERAVVLAHAAEDGRKMLAAYVIAEPGTDADELLALLRKRLPAVMVPAHIQFVESFPLGPNGKLDRRALPLPGLPSAARGRSITAPETELEIRLAAIWKNVLGVSEIGIHDDFFELGGDSIQSLRLVSIAAHEGLRLRPKHVFEHPTIAALALVVEMNAPAAAELRVDHTNIPLTPVQQDFFALNLPNPHHWNQAVLVKTRVSLNFARMESAWSLVASKHSAFRLRFAREAGGWRQFLADAAAPPILRAKLSELEQVGAQANASLHIEHGPLFKAVFAEGGSGPGRLLIVGHHLAVDGVSWRILLQELAMACEEESVPFEEEVSFSAWAASLAEEARSEQTKAEEARWLAVANGAASALPVDFADGTAGNTEGAVGSVQWSLDKAQTGLLLRELPMQFRCRVEEILLTALAASLEEWSGGEPLFELEGHGREEAITDLNISNTIGWFTNVYPVRLARSSDAWQRLRGVKETLRAVPRGGIGWGLLSHSAESRELFRACRPEVSFNYLGQIDLALHADGPFRPAH